MKQKITLIMLIMCILFLSACGATSENVLISDQEAMDIAYEMAVSEYTGSEYSSEDSSESIFVTYEVSEPTIFEKDKKNHTAVVSVLVMMKINGEGNSGMFQYYDVDLKTGNCTKEEKE